MHLLCIQGEFLEGKKSGKGVYQYLNGAYYDGDWLKDQKHG